MDGASAELWNEEMQEEEFKNVMEETECCFSPEDVTPEDMDHTTELTNTAPKQDVPTKATPVGDGTKFVQHSVTHRCAFHFKPEMLQYHYSPGSTGYLEGNPVLLGSPTFDGGWNTKWQINLTINQWIGMERWVSLFITRLDDEDEPLLMHCEFRIVSANGNTVLHSKRNVFENSWKSTTCGFTQFLPFQDALKMLGDDKSLCIDTHIMLMSFIPNCIPPNSAEESEKVEDISDGCSDVTAIVDPQDTVEKLPVCSDICVGDLLTVYLDTEPLTVVSRTRLMEKSFAYRQCARAEGKGTTKLRFSPLLQYEREFNQKIIREFAKFVQKDHCKILETGSYDELKALLEIAGKMEIDSLISQCLTMMSLNITWDNAVSMFLTSREYAKHADENVKYCVKEYFKRNFKQISKSEGFIAAAKDHAKDFIQLCFDPKAKK